MRNAASTSRPVRQGRWILMACTLGLVAITIAAHRAAPPGRASVGSTGPSTTVAHHSIPAPRDTVLPPATTPPGRTASAARPTAARPGAPPTTSAFVATATSPTTTPVGDSGNQGFGPAAVTPVTAAPVAPVIFRGWLSGPDSVSATYAFDAAAGRDVVATWSGAQRLALAVTCQGSPTTASGGSGLVLRAVGGSCTVTLSGPDDVATSTFEIAVRP